MPAVKWNAELLDQLDFTWNVHFLPRMEGLTDEEYLWEPVADCWSVRPQPDGTVTRDWSPEPSSPAPFTTIAWRMCHIGMEIFGMRASNHFGDGSLSVATFTAWPTTAESGLAFVNEHYQAWRAGVESLGEEGLLRPCDPAERPYAEEPLATLVLHINREFIHHAAEIALIRDLYTHSYGGRRWRRG